MRSKTIFTISMMVIFTLVLGVVAYSFVDNYLKKEIQQTEDKSLAGYFRGYGLAEDVMSILTIHDSASYDAVREKLYPYLSSELQREKFPTVEYEGETFSEPILKIMSVKGDLSKKDIDLYHYKVDISISYSNTPEIEATFIVGVRNGFVTKIERI